MPDQLSIQDFAGKVKSRFPQFAGMDDADLTRKILERRPELINQIQTSEKRPPLKRGKDEDSYLSQGVQGLKNVGKNLTVGMYEQSKVRAGEGVPPEAVGVPMPGAFIKNSIDDVLDGLQKGYEARQQARQQGEGIPGQILATAEQYPMVGPLVQKVEQSLTPKDLESAKSGPVLTPGGFGAVTEGIGYAAAPEALKKTGGALVKGAAKVIEKGPKAIQRGAQSILGVGPKLTEKAVSSANDVIGENAAKTADVASDNAAKTGDVAKREQLTQDAGQHSTKIGSGINDLVQKVRETEVNPRYDAVHKAVESDPGVPLSELASEARIAESKITGSPENIKQFREIIRGAPESQGVETSAGFTKPGEPLYDQLASEGAIDQGGNISFRQLQGYASEIGSKLARGGLEGDVYQALKYMQEKIKAAKQKIADRNGAGPHLTEADNYYRKFQNTFYGDNAVAQTLDRYGKYDPEFQADPFHGKMGKTGIEKLRQFSPELADAADRMRNIKQEANALPKKAVTKVAPQKNLPELDPSTLKTEKISKKADQLGSLNSFEVMALTESPIAAFSGHLGAALWGPAAIAVKRGASALLDTPAVMKWLSKPQEGDLAALRKLPQDIQSEVRKNMKNFVLQQQSAGTPFTVSPAVTKFLTGSAAESDKKKPADLKAAGKALAQ